MILFMTLFSGISDAEVYTVLTTIILMPVLFLISAFSALFYLSKSGGRNGRFLGIITILLFVNALILTIHQLLNNEPGLVLVICLVALVYSILILFRLYKDRKVR